MLATEPLSATASVQPAPAPRSKRTGTRAWIAAGAVALVVVLSVSYTTRLSHHLPPPATASAPTVLPVPYVASAEISKASSRRLYSQPPSEPPPPEPSGAKLTLNGSGFVKGSVVRCDGSRFVKGLS